RGLGRPCARVRGRAGAGLPRALTAPGKDAGARGLGRLLDVDGVGVASTEPAIHLLEGTLGLPRALSFAGPAASLHALTRLLRGRLPRALQAVLSHLLGPLQTILSHLLGALARDPSHPRL